MPTIAPRPFQRCVAALRLCLLVAAGSLAFTSYAAQAASADLVINIADNPDPGPAGGVFTYTVRVDDNGPDAASAVTLASTIPAGSTFVSVSSTQGTCDTTALPDINCAVGNLAFLGNATVTIKVILPQATVYTLSASTTSATPDPNTSNNSASESTTAVTAADMALAVVAPPGPLAAGTPFNYTLTSTNNGPYPLGAGDTQTIAFNVPAGACVTAAPTGTGWTCAPPAGGYPACGEQAISCTHPGPLATGASAPALTVPAVANIDGEITGEFDVTSTLPDGNLDNNVATASTESTGNSSDVSISKTASPATVALDSNVTYTLTPRFNGGTDPGSSPPGVITVTDVLPAGLDFVSAAGTGWTCDTTALPTITCTLPGPYTGGNYTNMPVITIIGKANTTGPISNTATIGAPEDDPVPGNNSSTIGVTASNDADLTLSKVASINPVVPNQAFNFTLTPRNTGPLAIPAGQTITVADDIPAGLNLTATPTGTGWTCTPNSGFPLAGPVSVSCTHAGPLNVDTNAPAITVPVVSPSTGPVSNTACATLSGTGPESATTNNCGTASITSTITEADLQLVSKTVTPDPVLAGQDLTYTISVINKGPDPSTNVTVKDALQSLVATGSLQSVTPSQGTCTPAAPANGATINLSCNLGTLNATDTASIVVVVRPSIALTGTRTNTASITSPDVGDPYQDNNSKSVTSSVTAVADMTVSKSASPNPVRGGTSLTYVLTAANAGPSTALNVIATDTLPTNAVFLSLGAVTGGGTCTTPAAGALGGQIQCTWASIAANVQRTATYVVRPLATAAGTNAVNSVVVTTDTLESTYSNNSTSTSTPITAASLDILVNKVDSADPVALGQSTTYTITINNAGPSFGTNVQMVDHFPSGSPTALFSYQGGLVITPAGAGTCTEPTIGVTTGVLTCAFPGLVSGGTILVQYNMTAEEITGPGVSGTAFNTVDVSVDEPETTLANNEATNATTTRRTADLALVKTAPTSATAGDSLTYTLTTTNNGPNPSTGAQVVDMLPAGTTFVSASTGCVNASGTVTCTLGTLAVNGTAAVTITVLVSNPYTGANPLPNSATVNAVNEVDPTPGNNGGSTTTTITGRVSDLSLTKTANTSVVAGSTLTYTLSVFNNGPDSSTGAQIVDVLPANVTFVSASTDCTNAAGTVTCTLPTIAANASTTETITVRVSASAPAGQPIANSATVTTVNETDPTPGNNTGTTSTNVTPPATPTGIPALSPALLLALALLVGMAGWGMRRRD